MTEGVEVRAENFIVLPDYIDIDRRCHHEIGQYHSETSYKLSTFKVEPNNRDVDRDYQTTQLPDRKSHTRGNDSLAFDLIANPAARCSVPVRNRS